MKNSRCGSMFWCWNWCVLGEGSVIPISSPVEKKDRSLVEGPGGRKQLLVHMYSGKLNANGGGGTHPA